MRWWARGDQVEQTEPMRSAAAGKPINPIGGSSRGTLIMILGISYLDYALVAMVAISGLVAMYRGFTREALSILSWLAAAAATFYVIIYQPDLAEWLASQFASSPQQTHRIIARVCVGTVIFLAVLIVVQLITSRISAAVQDSPVGPIDRTVGLAFGVIRGFILVVIPYMFWVSLVCKDGATLAIDQGCQPGELPHWVDDARSKDMIKRTGSTLRGVFYRIVSSG